MLAALEGLADSTAEVVGRVMDSLEEAGAFAVSLAAPAIVLAAVESFCQEAVQRRAAAGGGGVSA
ncbi:hypothetical protein BGM09_00900 [Streptomyces sp. CBMA29]|nr:hypothetical protein [Streptomyces sp. CBMA29]